MNETDKISDQPNDRSLLRDLLPGARRLAETMTTQRPTPVGADLMAFLTEAHVDDVRIVEGRKGGYLAQILLKDIPLGLPRSVGTHRRMPHTTRQLAIDHGKRMLAEIVRAKPAASAPEGLFRLSHQTFVLGGDKLLAASRGPIPAHEVPLILATIYKKYFTGESSVGYRRPYDTLPDGERREIEIALYQAAVNGVLEYPPSDVAGDPVPADPLAGLFPDERQVVEAADAERRFRVNRERIFNALTAAGIGGVTCTYSGSGDSGNIDDVEADRGDLTATSVLTETSRHWSGWDEATGGWGHFATEMQEEVSINKAIETLCWDKLEDLHGGWENDDGGNGEFELNVAERTITLTHHQAYTQYETSENEL
jgi:hypothetical protein